MATLRKEMSCFAKDVRDRYLISTKKGIRSISKKRVAIEKQSRNRASYRKNLGTVLKLEHYDPVSRLVSSKAYKKIECNNMGTVLVPNALMKKLNHLHNGYGNIINGFGTVKFLKQMIERAGDKEFESERVYLSTLLRGYDTEKKGDLSAFLNENLREYSGRCAAPRAAIETTSCAQLLVKITLKKKNDPELTPFIETVQITENMCVSMSPPSVINKTHVKKIFIFNFFCDLV
jgi:hypothetical protein